MIRFTPGQRNVSHLMEALPTLPADLVKLVDSYHASDLTPAKLDPEEAGQVDELIKAEASGPSVDVEISKDGPLHSGVGFGSIFVVKNLSTDEVLMMSVGMDDGPPSEDPDCAQFLKLPGDKEVLCISSTYSPHDTEEYTNSISALDGVGRVISAGNVTVSSKSISAVFLPASNKLVFDIKGQLVTYGDIFSRQGGSSEDKKADIQRHGIAVEANLRERESKEASPGNAVGYSAPVTHPSAAAAGAENPPSALESKKSQPPQSASVGSDLRTGVGAIGQWLRVKNWLPKYTEIARTAAHMRLEAEQRKGTALHEATHLAIAAGVLAVRLEMNDTGAKLRQVLNPAQLQDLQEAAIRVGARSAAQEAAQQKNPGFSDVDSVLRGALAVATKVDQGDFQRGYARFLDLLKGGMNPGDAANAAIADGASKGRPVQASPRERESKEASPGNGLGHSAPVTHPGPAAAAGAENPASALESKKSQPAHAGVDIEFTRRGVGAIGQWLRVKNWLPKYTEIARTAAHRRLEAEQRKGTALHEATHLAIAAGVLAVRLEMNDTGAKLRQVLNPAQLQDLQEAAIRAGARSAAQEAAQQKNPGFSDVDSVLRGALAVATKVDQGDFQGAYARFLDSLKLA